MLPYHYIAVDGPIGVGKTTLVDMLARRFEGVKLLEDVGNPFLTDFYDDRTGSAFQTELYFLLTRFKQQQDIAQRGLFDRLLLSDYTFPKNRIFAYLNLSDAELMLFDKLYTLLEPQIAKPDLVIYLNADLATCKSRIQRRARDFERRISDDYLRELLDAYAHYYHHFDESPVLAIDTRNLNFVDRPEDFEELLAQLERPLRGTQYYVPRGSA